MKNCFKIPETIFLCLKQDVCREKVPNDWELQGELYLEEQCEWYQAMFEACKNRSWLRGFALWEWAPKLPSESEAWKDDSYEICNKPVQEVIRRFYENETEKYFTACTEK